MELNAPQSADQCWSHLSQFARVIGGKFVEELPALAREAEDGATLVVFVDCSFDEAFALRPIYQLNGAVVLKPEPARSVGDGDGCSLGCASDLKEELVLLGMKAGAKRSVFAELEECAQLETEFGEGREKAIARGGIYCHFIYIVSRYILRIKKPRVSASRCTRVNYCSDAE